MRFKCLIQLVNRFAAPWISVKLRIFLCRKCYRNRDLINELAVMVTVGEHPNVLSLIGACTKTGNF